MSGDTKSPSTNATSLQPLGFLGANAQQQEPIEEKPQQQNTIASTSPSWMTPVVAWSASILFFSILALDGSYIGAIGWSPHGHLSHAASKAFAFTNPGSPLFFAVAVAIFALCIFAAVEASLRARAEARRACAEETKGESNNNAKVIGAQAAAWFVCIVGGFMSCSPGMHIRLPAWVSHVGPAVIALGVLGLAIVNYVEGCRSTDEKDRAIHKGLGWKIGIQMPALTLCAVAALSPKFVATHHAFVLVMFFAVIIGLIGPGTMIFKDNVGGLFQKKSGGAKDSDIAALQTSP